MRISMTCPYCETDFETHVSHHREKVSCSNCGLVFGMDAANQNRVKAATRIQVQTKQSLNDLKEGPTKTPVHPKEGKSFESTCWFFGTILLVAAFVSAATNGGGGAMGISGFLLFVLAKLSEIRVELKRIEYHLNARPSNDDE